MIFYITKVAWYVTQPSSLLLLLFVAGLTLYRFGRPKAGIRIIAVTVAIYGIVGISPLANAITVLLEERYSKPPVEDAGQVDGMIVLGGVVDTLTSDPRNEIGLSEGAERLTEAAALAHRYPKARIVISGGDGALIYQSTDEATLAKQFFTRLGLDPARITLETQSRTTWENAVYTRQIIAPKPGERWLLITSAFHMRRAMGLFRAAGFDVAPWPVDFRTRGVQDYWRFAPRPSEAWRRMDLITREWAGILFYSLTGRIK